MVAFGSDVPPMSGSIVTAVVFAAALHAAWNAVAHAIGDRLIGFALINIVYTVVGAAMVVVSPVPAEPSRPLIALSAALHVAYNLFLLRSYELGEFGEAYALARGTSPWLVTLGAYLFAGERLDTTTVAGVGVVSVGLVALVLAGGRPTWARLPAIAAAVLTGVIIASYSTVDGLGVRMAGTTAGYLGWLFLLQGPVLPAVAIAVRRQSLWPQPRGRVAAGVAAGAMALIAYAAVLWAQARGPLGPVAALRETSIVFGAFIASLLFHERFGAGRVAAAIVVAAGVVLMIVAR